MTEKLLEWCKIHPVLYKVYFGLLMVVCLYGVGYVIGKFICNIIN